MRLASFAVLALALSAAAQTPPPPAAPAAAKPTQPDLAFDGRYVIVTGERDGRPIPDERVVGKTVRIEKDRIVGVDAAGKEFLDVTFSVDATRAPALLKMKSVLPVAGETTGLIEKTGDTVRLIYAAPGSPPPTAFRTQPMQFMFALRAAPAANDPKKK